MKSKVFFTKEITADSLIKMYETLGVELPGKVGVKVATCEVIDGEATLYVYTDSKKLLSNLF
jgi:hypothetical protein